MEQVEIKEKTVYGVIGKNLEELKKELYKSLPHNKIYYISKEFQFHSSYQNLYSRMEYEIKRRNLIVKNPEKKIIDSLKIVGLNPKLLNQDIHTLSTSERKLIQVALCLITNPSIIVIEEPFQEFDKEKIKKLVILLQKVKEQYNKTIMFTSDNSNELYQYTEEIILFYNKKDILIENTKAFFQNIALLKKHRINIPDIIEITYLAKQKKNIKLEYHKDIRDIIKDIYKHV